MEMTPQRIRSAKFKTVRKGVDANEVRVFLDDVADELERAQNQATAMEARARATVARLQEVSETPATPIAAPVAPGAPAAPAAPPVAATVEESEISRALLLAQRTADSTIAEATSTASKLIADANDEAARTRESTRDMAEQMVEAARVDARQSGAAELASVTEEVEALKARRDFLESDVHHLEIFLADQRSRVREAGTSLIELSERVPGGLGVARGPLLSASDDDDDDDDTGDNDGDVVDELVIVADIADEESAEPTDSGEGRRNDAADIGQGRVDDEDPWATPSGVDDPTQAMPIVREAADEDDGDQFRF